MSTIEKIQQICREVFSEPDLTLTSDLQIKDIPKWDSYGHLHLVVALEEHFGVQFNLEELGQINKIGEFADYIEHSLKRSSSH